MSRTAGIGQENWEEQEGRKERDIRGRKRFEVGGACLFLEKDGMEKEKGWRGGSKGGRRLVHLATP